MQIRIEVSKKDQILLETEIKDLREWADNMVAARLFSLEEKVIPLVINELRQRRMNVPEDDLELLRVGLEIGVIKALKDVEADDSLPVIEADE